jgi:2-oxoglutarate dehydrogenase complex dehydrogenase (E1) component-like enzyme
MPGQGAIIRHWRDRLSAEYRGVPEEMRASLGLSKVMTVTSTYDHRVIQGANRGCFSGLCNRCSKAKKDSTRASSPTLAFRFNPGVGKPTRRPPPPSTPIRSSTAALAQFISTWRERGHLLAQLDPLGSMRAPHADLEPAAHGLTIWVLDRTFHAGLSVSRHCARCSISLRAIYAGTTVCSTCHIENPEERQWLQHRLESPDAGRTLAPELRAGVLETIVSAEDFDVFLIHVLKVTSAFRSKAPK